MEHLEFTVVVAFPSMAEVVGLDTCSQGSYFAMVVATMGLQKKIDRSQAASFVTSQVTEMVASY